MVSGYHTGQCPHRTFPSQKILLTVLLWDLDFSFSFLFTHLSVSSQLVTSAEEFVGPKKERDISVNFASKRLLVALGRKQLGCDR